ncbi:MAG: hypothetical protein R2795_25270, partial [Saprospiraceae bacterium]
MKRYLVLLLPFLLYSCRHIPEGSSAALPARIESLGVVASHHVPARQVDVWLPAAYDTAHRYAVLYMHDGQMLFDSTQTWNHQEWGV